MINVVEKQFDRLAKKIKERSNALVKGLGAYFKRLLFPLYLFPIKLVTYTLYYAGLFAIKFVFSLIKILLDTIIYPWKSLKNFLKSLFIVGTALYMVASLFVIVDYLSRTYGDWGKFLCSYGTRENLEASTVRIVGGYSEGSGFFIDSNRVITNFHVIADEPSPKIILPDGDFITPIKIIGDKNADLALLITDKDYHDIALPLRSVKGFYEQEPLLAAGYPLGTDIAGNATVVTGNFIDYRQSSRDPVTSY